MATSKTKFLTASELKVLRVVENQKIFKILKIRIVKGEFL